MKVLEKYSIDEDEIYERSKLNMYWEDAYKFYTKVKNASIEILSDKQNNWLERIERDLEE